MYNNPDKTLYLAWIKTHAGLIGNERADLLAKSVIEQGTADIDINWPYPRSLVNKVIKDNIRREWQQRWISSSKGRFTFKILNKVDESLVSPNRILKYFLSNHGAFPSFLHKIKKRPTELCDCGQVGDPVHYLFSRCPLMPSSFNFNRDRTLRQNMTDVLFDSRNYRKLCIIYNKLNSLFSFIKYKF